MLLVRMKLRNLAYQRSQHVLSTRNSSAEHLLPCHSVGRFVNRTHPWDSTERGIMLAISKRWSSLFGSLPILPPHIRSFYYIALCRLGLTSCDSIRQQEQDCTSTPIGLGPGAFFPIFGRRGRLSYARGVFRVFI